MSDTIKVDIHCDGPGPHDPSDGILGEADRAVTGMRCASEACRVVPETTPADEARAVVEAVRNPDQPMPSIEERLAALEALAVPEHP